MPAFIAGQNLKTYSGNFEKGTATYQYYEKDNGERVYDGKFHYEYEDHADNYPFQSFEGLYSNGQRTGKWIFHYESRRKDLLSVIHKTYTYKNGTLDGDINDYRYIVETKDGIQKKTINYDYKFLYKNGKPYGAFDFEGIYPFKTTLIGRLDSLGFADGDWHIIDMFADPRQQGTSTKFDCKRTYRHGTLLISKIINTETGSIIEDHKFEIPNVSDTTYFKIVETVLKNVSCTDKNLTDCPYKNKDLQELVSKVLPFTYFTKGYSYASTKYAASQYKILAENYKENERKYLAEFAGTNVMPRGQLYLSYSGKMEGILKATSSQRATYFKVDTSKAFVNANNRLYEILYKSYMLQEIYAAAFNKRTNSPKENIITLSKQVQKYNLPEKFWEQRGEAHVLAPNLDYSYLFNEPGLKPESFLEQFIEYSKALQQEFEINLGVVREVIGILNQKEKVRREKELGR